MDLAFVGGEGEWTKDLNRVLLVPLSAATFGRISSGRKLDYSTIISRTERVTLGGTQPLGAPIDSPAQVPSGEFCRVGIEEQHPVDRHCSRSRLFARGDRDLDDLRGLWNCSVLEDRRNLDVPQELQDA